MKLCGWCGTECEDKRRFCPKCGLPLGKPVMARKSQRDARGDRDDKSGADKPIVAP